MDMGCCNSEFHALCDRHYSVAHLRFKQINEQLNFCLYLKTFQLKSIFIFLCEIPMLNKLY